MLSSQLKQIPRWDGVLLCVQSYFLCKKRALTGELQVETLLIPDGSELKSSSCCCSRATKEIPQNCRPQKNLLKKDWRKKEAAPQLWLPSLCCDIQECNFWYVFHHDSFKRSLFRCSRQKTHLKEPLEKVLQILFVGTQLGVSIVFYVSWRIELWCA